MDDEVQPDDLPPFRRMPVPEALAWLAEHGEPADPRTGIDTASLRERFPRLAAVECADVTVPTDAGGVAGRWYVDPTAVPAGRAFVWVHGGGFIGGHLDMPEANWVALELAAAGVPVLSVDYRKCLAGVHFPAPADDVAAAWRYALAEVRSRTGVSQDRLCLGGASAGGALAAGLVERLVQADDALPERLVLVYPVLHPNGPEASAEVDPASPHGQLTLNYAGDERGMRDPVAFAGLGDGSGFPPTLILVCEQDALRPSGEAFARTLESAGRQVVLSCEAGAAHGHIDHPGRADALRTIERMRSWLVE